MALKQDKYNNKLIKLMKTNHCKMELLKPVNSYKSLLTVYYNTEGKSKNFKILMFNYIQTCCLL